MGQNVYSKEAALSKLADWYFIIQEYNRFIDESMDDGDEVLLGLLGDYKQKDIAVMAGVGQDRISHIIGRTKESRVNRRGYACISKPMILRLGRILIDGNDPR